MSAETPRARSSSTAGEVDELGVAAIDRVRGAEDDDVSLTDGDDDGVRRVIRPSDGLRGLVSDAFDGAALPRSTDECVVAAVAR